MTTDFIYLASASPRRSELLGQIGVPFRTRVPAVSESRLTGEAPQDYVKRVAGAKADAVWAEVRQTEPAPVLAADTAVVVDDEIYGKPVTPDQALAMLGHLSGRSHLVLTAIALCWRDLREVRVSVSEVRFRPMTEAERVAYCRSGEPFDKAGGYAIQGLGAVFIEHLDGSYSSVMGLPLAETTELLARFGLPAWLRTGARVA